jgi:hypothetical protein
MNFNQAILFGMAALFFSACACGCLQQGNQEKTVTGTGTITHMELEGGFYGLIASDGTRYLPLNLDDLFKVDGMNVTFEGILRDDVATIQQWGIPLEITYMGEGGQQSAK